MNMTMVTSKSTNLSGKLILLKGIAAPYEKHIRPFCAFDIAGIVILRDRSGEPGQSMFLVDVSDQKDINKPIVEIFQSPKSKNSLYELKDNIELDVSLYPDENGWKRVNENKFQLFANIFLSLFEMVIISICSYRLYQFWTFEGLRPSIGQICLLLELVATLLRFSFTIVDPFWTYRMFHNTANMFLLTIHIPFSLSAGILLTFFCT
jgi:hypothetical protein